MHRRGAFFFPASILGRVNIGAAPLTTFSLAHASFWRIAAISILKESMRGGSRVT